MASGSESITDLVGGNIPQEALTMGTRAFRMHLSSSMKDLSEAQNDCELA